MFATLSLRKDMQKMQSERAGRSKPPRPWACEACCTQKVKCDGPRDGCERCKKKGITCVPSTRKRLAVKGGDHHESPNALQPLGNEALGDDFMDVEFLSAPLAGELEDAIPPVVRRESGDVMLQDKSIPVSRRTADADESYSVSSASANISQGNFTLGNIFHDSVGILEDPMCQCEVSWAEFLGQKSETMHSTILLLQKALTMTKTAILLLDQMLNCPMCQHEEKRMACLMERLNLTILSIRWAKQASIKGRALFGVGESRENDVTPGVGLLFGSTCIGKYLLDTAGEHWSVAAALAHHHEQLAAKFLQRCQIHFEIKNWRSYDVLIRELQRDLQKT